MIDTNLVVSLLEQQKEQTMIDLRYQFYSPGDEIFNSHQKENESSFDEVFHDTWNAVFQPSPPVARLIRQRMEELDLQPNEYSAAHVRWNHFAVWKGFNLTYLFENALHCANQLQPGAPIYVASDTAHVIELATQLCETNRTKIRRGQVRARKVYNNPMHLDESASRKASDYFETFVDIYLLAGAKCVTHNVGGYGRWGRRLSFQQNCSILHHLNYCD